MNLMDTAQLLGNFGEFFGAIAVVATLIYLATQIRQNTRSMDETRRVALTGSYQSRHDALAAINRRIADSEDLAAISVKALEAGWPANSVSLDVLTPVERQRWEAHNETIFLSVENLAYQHEQGMVDAELYESNVRNTIARFGLVWKAFGFVDRLGRPSFRREIERVLAEGNGDS